MSKRDIQAGSAGQSMEIFVQNNGVTTGAGLTGLVYNTASLTCYYIRSRSAPVSVTLATLAAVTSAYSSGGFKELDATNTPGMYRFDPPDAALAAGSPSVIFFFKGATNMAPLPIEIALTGWNNQDGVRGGMAALPAAAFEAVGGLHTSILAAGTAAAGTSDGITLQTALGADTRARGLTIDLMGGTGAGQSRSCRAYVNSTKVFSVNRPWTVNPDNTTVYRVRYDCGEGAMEGHLFTSVNPCNLRQGVTGLLTGMGPNVGLGGATVTTALPDIMAAGTPAWEFGYNLTTREKTSAEWTPPV